MKNLKEDFRYKKPANLLLFYKSSLNKKLYKKASILDNSCFFSTNTIIVFIFYMIFLS